MLGYLANTLAVSVGLVLTALVHPALAQKRVALVIGNAAYQHTAKLANPGNDATDMVAALKRRGGYQPDFRFGNGGFRVARSL